MKLGKAEVPRSMQIKYIEAALFMYMEIDAYI